MTMIMKGYIFYASDAFDLNARPLLSKLDDFLHCAPYYLY